MKPLKQAYLPAVFINPKFALTLTLPQWGVLMGQARQANVLARLGFLLQDAGLLEKIPAQPLAHIQSALTFSARFTLSLQWEIDCIETALAAVDAPIIYLKGCAYHVAGNRAAKGRIFSDVDILVPEAKLPEVEAALIKAGWMTSTFDGYDQKYYRQWMHEIPPMRHLKRQTSIDVHHNILPKTCKFSPDAHQLLAGSVKLPEKNRWVLSPEDRVLHSAVHLFYGGEFEQGFRDLSDIDLLLKEFSVQDNFWGNLLRRAEALNQQRALFYALRYARAILKTPVPDAMLENPQTIMGKAHAQLMDALFISALQPNHNSYTTHWTQIARSLLFMRSHWLKMPVHLLVAHLYIKSLRHIKGEDKH
jgi:hypothetical protein